MANAILALQPLLRHLTGQPGTVTFAGEPVATEAWLRAGKCSVGIFQEDTSVRVVLWVGRQPQVFEPGQPLRSLPLWARPALRAQLEQDAASAPQGRPPRWPPTLSDVLTRLRAGGRAQNGGGRYYSIYYFQDSRLRRTVFDEGVTTDEEADTERLAADIARHPEYFV